MSREIARRYGKCSMASRATNRLLYSFSRERTTRERLWNRLTSFGIMFLFSCITGFYPKIIVEGRKVPI